MSITAYPLAWPPDWKSTDALKRKAASFGSSSWRSTGDGTGYHVKGAISVAIATERVRTELERLGVRDDDLVISTNLKLRLDGLPRSDQAEPKHPGAAVYWKRPGEHMRCMAIDRYTRVADNLAAIAATLEAMRAIERHGGAAILDRAFTGFVALPAPEQPHEILGLAPGSAVTRHEIEQAYRRLASQHHPDRPGGSAEKMAKINQARDHLIARVERLGG